MKRSLLAACAVLATAAGAYAAFKFLPLKSPPKPANIGEVIFNRADWRANNSERVRMERDEFMRFFREGVFRNDIHGLVYGSGHFEKPLNDKGGWQYCSGAFATKDGKVFFWNRPRVGVLEITNNEYHAGWLVLPEFMKQVGERARVLKRSPTQDAPATRGTPQR